MFPNGWPGKGLLLLRLILVLLVLQEAVVAWIRPLLLGVLPGALLAPIVALACVGLLLLGLGTPFVSIILAVCEIWMAASNRLEWRIALACSGVALALAMLGPGAMSIDARLFGRKRIDYHS